MRVLGRSSAWLPDLAWCGFLLGLTLLYYWRYLGWAGPQASFGGSDFTNIFWPFHQFNLREWAAGRAPLWNPSFNGGQPHLANPETAVFYPFALVELALNGRGGPMTGIYTRLWLDTSLAAVGMYLLVRRLTRERAAAALGGVSYALSGLITGYAANQTSYLEALAWVPLGLFFLDWALASARPWLVAWLGGWCLAPLFLGGYPQIWLLAPMAVIVTALAARARGLAASPGRVIQVLGVVALAASSLAAVQLVPAFEFFFQSDRSTYLGVGRGYTWGQLLGLVQPGADGDLGMYVGIAVPALGLAAFLVGRTRRLALVWGGAAALGLLLALGDTTPAYDLIWSHLGFGLFRNQTRNIALTVLALSVLGGIGLAALAARWPRARPALALLPALAAANLLAVNWSNNWPIPEPYVSQAERRPQVLARLVEAQRIERGRFAIDGDKRIFSPQAVFAYDLETIDSELNFGLRRPYELLHTQEFWRQWQLFNVRHVVAARELRGEGIAEVTREGELRLYRVLYPLPRAYVVWNTVLADSPDDARAAVLRADFVPGESAVIEAPLSRPLTRPAEPRQDVRLTYFDPQETRLQVSIPSDGLLVVSQPYYPGWRAEIDGQPADLLRSNYAFMALEVPAGQHQVRLFFDPLSFKLGAVISCLSLLAFPVVLAVGPGRQTVFFGGQASRPRDPAAGSPARADAPERRAAAGLAGPAR